MSEADLKGARGVNTSNLATHLKAEADKIDKNKQKMQSIMMSRKEN